ncbi:phosphatase PAP2 family protein [Micromonospora auratinigra]|uniref:PAP2 superfamily protein n=1 Tax=Micromonospora auratinigra TaxID=261654 RepID=A0A1A8ZXQ0_9ACTN|nr:phosphatase PAP2 family protein [Micromonospora auratinigra]SBT48698.1 PAP2 superfamily protein [Micromonospora auratinigra]
MRQTTEVREKPLLRPVRPAGWWFDGLLLAALAGLTVALATGHLYGLDLDVSGWAFAHDPAPLYWTARLFNLLGQGGALLMPLSGALALAVAWRRHSIRPLLLVAGTLVLTYCTIGPFKVWTDRAAPTATVRSPFLSPEQAVRIFNEDLPARAYDMSYPSGHVANAIVWYGVIALLLAALTAGRLPAGVYRLIRVAPPVILLVTTTYLNFHWITDGVGGLLLGLLLDRVLHRVPWDDLPLPGALRNWDHPFIPYP